MAGVVATTIDWKFGSNGTPTTLVDNSTKFNSVDFPRQQDMKDITPFGQTAKSYAVGLSEATFKADAFWDATLDAQLDALIGYITPINFQFGPQGTTAGYPKYTGVMILKSVGRPVKVGDVMMMSCEFQISGAITRAVY